MTLRLDTPEAALAATPYLITFMPADSLVLLLLTEHRTLQVSLRVDLPVAGDPKWLLTILQSIPDPVPDAVLLIAYADTFPADHAEAAGRWVMLALAPVMDVIDLIVVNGGAFRSVLRDEGVEQVHDMAEVLEHPVVAECIGAGMTCAPNRDVLVAAMAHIDDEVTDQVRRALRVSITGDHRRRRDELEETALRLLRADGPLSAQDVACVARACRDVHVRDPLLTILLAECADDVGLGRVRTRLVYCLRHTPGRHAGSVAATLALVCWADGDGAAALVAVDRAMESDPANTLAPLVADALQNSLPPDTWSKITGDIPLDVLRGRGRRSA